jgi:hypothetical protein
MKFRIVMLLAAAVVLQLGAESLQACGDKYLLNGRGAKFKQAYAAIYPASVVIFARPQRGSAKEIRDPRLLADLKQAGHRVAVVEDERALTRTLEAERVDVVLTDGADADQLTTQAATIATRPKVLPVLFKATKTEQKTFETRYQLYLSSSAGSIRFLSAIDDVMKARKKKAA